MHPLYDEFVSYLDAEDKENAFRLSFPAWEINPSVS
jgi:hypothetical protein